MTVIDAPTPTADVVTVNNVKKSFGHVEVLRGVDFAIGLGEVVCLIGPSGSGKSTLLRCIAGLEVPTGGLVCIENVPMGFRAVRGELIECSGRHAARQRERVGMVFQNFNLFPHMTVLDNICLAQVRVKRIAKAQARERARELLARVGLAEKANAYPLELSGGQQQRVAIARALAMEPLVMLFDEPTSALDPELVYEVLSVMRDLANDGTTMIISTHEMRFAREVANRVLFLDEGCIIEQGSASDLFDHPRNERTRTFLRHFANAELRADS